MTENEAIRDLQYLIGEYSAYPPETGVNVTIGSLQYCITALKKIQQYRKIGTVEECREAREKQILKRPVWKEGRSVICKDYADRHGEVEENKWADWVCPNCGWFVGEQYISRRHNQNKSNYCSRCGQAIQWDENLEEMEDD